jgi:hypothetical protein
MPSFLETARQIVSDQQARADAHLTGVCWSGLQPDAPKVETVEAVAERLERDARKRAEWRLTPRGRLFIAIEDLRECGFHDEAQKLYGFFNRSLSDERQPLNVKALASCLIILDGLTVSTAREASKALHEMLLETRPAMMAAE